MPPGFNLILPTLKFEKELWEKGFRNVCGIDEVGRGCFAGPVVIGAVIFPPSIALLEGVADSKLLKPRQREKLVDTIKTSAVAWTIVEISVTDINKVGIGKAVQMGFRKAVKTISKNPDFILMDAFYIKHLNRKNQKAIIKGDTLSLSIAAASIIAKVHRDKLMKKLHFKYPEYGFGKHKGYGTKKHQEAIKKHGLSRVHRKSFNLTRFTI